MRVLQRTTAHLGLVYAAWVRAIAVAAIGAGLGFCAETVHRAAGVWTLPGGGAMPAWVAIVYFAGLYGAVTVLGRIPARRPSGRAVALEALLAVALFLAPPLAHAHELFLAAAATAFVAVRLVGFRAPGDVAVALGLAGADLIIEGTLVAAGLYHYENAAFGPLPLWLPALWAGLALSLRRLFAAVTAPWAARP
jgi:hypothetical protein